MSFSNRQDIQFIGDGGELTAAEELVVQELQQLSDSAEGEAIVKSGGSFVNATVAGTNFIREDISDQCDGVTKVFTVSNNYQSGKIYIVGTQFPRVYRPIIDFTESGSNEITLTSAVSAPATGQSLIAIYQKQS